MNSKAVYMQIGAIFTIRNALNGLNIRLGIDAPVERNTVCLSRPLSFHLTLAFFPLPCVTTQPKLRVPLSRPRGFFRSTVTTVVLSR